MRTSHAGYLKPLPLMEPEEAAYWGHLKQHRMHIQRCAECTRFFFPPSSFCPNCLSDDVPWTPVSGRGLVYSTVTMHRAYTPAYADDIPYNVSLVDLEEGVRVWTNVVDCDPADVSCNMSVELVFDDVTDEVTLAKFRPTNVERREA